MRCHTKAVTALRTNKFYVLTQLQALNSEKPSPKTATRKRGPNEVGPLHLDSVNILAMVLNLYDY